MKFFQGLSRNTYLLALTSFFADVGSEMLYPVLPIFLTQTLKNSAGMVGLIEGFATASVYISQGLSGWLSDRLGKRKLIALIGYAISGPTKMAMGLSQTGFQALLGRASERFGGGFRSAPRDALIAESVAPQNRGKAFGLEGIGDNLGAVLGPLLSAFLIFYFAINLRYIFYLAFIPAALSFLMMLFVQEKSNNSSTAAGRPMEVSRFPKSYWRYLLVTAIFGLGNTSNAFLILKTNLAGATTVNATLIYALFNLTAALVSLPGGSLSDKFGRKKLLLFCFSVAGLTYAGFALSRRLPLLGLLFIFYGIYSGIYRAVGKSFAVDFVESRQYARAVGFYSATIGFTGLVGNLLAGQIWDKISPAASFYYGLIFCVLGILSLTLLIKEEKKPAGQF